MTLALLVAVARDEEVAMRATAHTSATRDDICPRRSKAKVIDAHVLGTR
ncbi:hypothetical protein MPLSOD_120208 [Mesorhizobium sp. SOD10]|nr:hypothetical protein MPLSOD_120208 [Mesorhizobium sp. SOD10]